MYIETYCERNGPCLQLKVSPSAYQYHKIITGNPLMMQQLHPIQKISSSSVPVIITGETGTGKELYAEYIHSTSSRKGKSYAKINCATIPANLFESEIFGYEAGAFTGALKTGKQGIFEIADQGTLFLDEISELPLALQSKFLRVLQEGTFVKVGGNREQSIDVRLVAATNKDLKTLSDKGLFRKDLFYRLNVVPIELLPLRKRKEDIILLTFYFMDLFNKTYQADKKISVGLMDEFLAYNWPGNVRELRNAVERLVLLSDGDILEDVSILENTLEKDPFPINDFNVETKISPRVRAVEQVGGDKTLKEIVAEYEIFIINESIGKYGSLRKAAAALHTSPSVLSRKLSDYRKKTGLQKK